MTTLPIDFLATHGGLPVLVEALGGGEGAARFVGGMVRDALLGIDAADIDLATRLAPEEVMRRVRRAGLKAIPTGIAHGTITTVLPSGPVEVTTLRRDVSTDGRHAIVAYTDDWREDAARRDFTINALYADPVNGEVFDYFGGLDDLAARRVRFIGDPLQRIAEDHLRILRFFRFHARFGDAIDAVGLDACVARANDLMALSRERIAGELLKLLVAPAAVPVVALMAERGVFLPILPEIDAGGVARFTRLAQREAAAGIAANPIRRLAALLSPDAVEAIGARLKLSNADRKRLSNAKLPWTGGMEELGYRAGMTEAVDRLLLGDAPPDRLSAFAKWRPPRLPLTGGALVERGLGKGPDVARMLRAIENQWIAEGFPREDRVGTIADEMTAQALRSASKA